MRIPYLDGQCELWVGVIQQYDGLWHSHVLPHADVVEQRRLLDVNGHVDHSDVRIVELVQSVDLAKVQVLEVHVAQIGLHTAMQTTSELCTFKQQHAIIYAEQYLKCEKLSIISSIGGYDTRPGLEDCMTDSIVHSMGTHRRQKALSTQ